MVRSDFLEKIELINVWKRRGQRAPNKPLLLLLAFGRVLDEGERLMPYSQIEGQLKELLKRFGPPRQTVHAEFPFGRLPNDGLWEIPQDKTLSRTASGDFLIEELRGVEESRYQRVGLLAAFAAAPCTIAKRAVVRSLTERSSEGAGDGR